MKDNNQGDMSIRRIAELCGVSIATVSRAMNHPELVNPDTLEKIEKVIGTYNYVPNELAKQLYSKSTNSIALFVYDITNPFYTRLISQMNKAAFDRDYTLIICDSGNDEAREKKYLKYLMGIRVSGIIFTEGSMDSAIGILTKRVPCVCIDRKFAVDGVDLPRVTSMNTGGAKKAVERLIENGHRKIGFAGLQQVLTSVERYEGYKQALEENGIDVPDEYVYRAGQMLESCGEEAMDYYFAMKDRPTALMCSNDMVAKGVISKAKELGVSVPGELSVIGFDGADSGGSFDFTTVQQNVDKIAETALGMLFKAMSGEKPKDELVPVVIKPGFSDDVNKV